MTRIPAWRRYLRFWRPEIDRDIDEELAFHLDERVEELMALRIPRDEALRQARAELGDASTLRAGLKEIDGRIASRRASIEWWGALAGDVRHTLRGFKRTPGFAMLIVITLALGIGANTAVFSMVDATLLRPLPFREPERLVIVHTAPVSVPQLAAAGGVFEAVGEYAVGSLNLTGGAVGDRIAVAQVTPNVFPMIGVAPLIGMGFTEADGRPSGPDVAILSYATWQRQFGGDRAVVGRRILLNEHPYTVVGVMPANFGFPNAATLWIPLTTPMSPNRTEMFKMLLETTAIARLRPGATLAAANATVCAIIRRRSPNIPNCETLGIVTQLRAELLADTRTAMLIVWGVVALLLLIACANVSSMLLVRAPGRRRELAVRASLGASRGRLVRQLLVESMTLGLAGGLAGLIVAEGGILLLAGMVPTGIADIARIHLDGRVLGATLLAALATGLLFGLAPAFLATRGDLHESLRATQTTTGLRSARRLGGILVAFEIAAALVLSVGAGLLIKSLVRLVDTNAGVETVSLMTGRVALSRATYASPASRRPFFQAIRDRLTRDPAVRSMAIVSALPLRGDRSVEFSVDVPDAPAAAQETGLFAEYVTASAGYFETMGIHVVAGRTFSSDDRPGSPRVAIVSEGFASRAWPGQSAVGKHIIVTGDTASHTVVGVVRDVQTESLEKAHQRQTYVDFDQMPSFEATIIVRGDGSPIMLGALISDAVRAADSRQVVFDLETMDAVVSGTLVSRRTNVMLISAFGAIAVLLSAVGIYALLAFAVAQRTREIGIRMALGARQGDVMRLVVRDAAIAGGLGIVVGITAAVAFTRVLHSLLYEVSPLDMPTFVIAAIVVVVVVAIASVAPARRATRVDPLIAIRME